MEQRWVGWCLGGWDCFVLIHSIHAFQRWRNHFWFIWSDLGACFFLQTFFFPLGNQSHSVFLTPHFAPLPCRLPRSPENRMEAHKSPTCFRWPDKSCVPCLLNLGRLLWLRNGEALPSVGWEYGRPVGGGGSSTIQWAVIIPELSKPLLYLIPRLQGCKWGRRVLGALRGKDISSLSENTMAHSGSSNSLTKTDTWLLKLGHSKSECLNRENSKCC